MAQIVTETGRTFRSEDEALDFIRACTRTIMDDPDTTRVETGMAVIEMISVFRALDTMLISGMAPVPTSWGLALPAGW